MPGEHNLTYSNKRFFITGLMAGLALLVVYFFVLSAANSFSHAAENFSEMWYWILILAGGFGLQAGLYFFIRARIRLKQMKNPTAAVGASAGVSAGSMVACCLHHLVDVLPILGLSAAFLFLSEYQVLFIILGVLSNVVGVIFMLEIIKRYSLHQKAGLLNRLARFDMKAVRNWSIAASALVLLFSFFVIKSSPENNSAVAAVSELPSKELELGNSLPQRINNEGGLSVEVRPIDFSFGGRSQFEVFLNTHQGDLDFDLNEKAFLIDEKDNQYLPLEWQGGRGGHHISGVLVFPAVAEAKKIKLIISDVYNIKEREFLWDLETLLR